MEKSFQRLSGFLVFNQKSFPQRENIGCLHYDDNLHKGRAAKVDPVPISLRLLSIQYIPHTKNVLHITHSYKLDI